jgi:arylsulfatase A-like enzyme
VSAVRSGDWKLLEYFPDNHVELYCLRDDPGEQHDLAATQPERAAQLRTRLHEWWKEVGAQLPQANPGYRPRKSKASP